MQLRSVDAEDAVLVAIAGADRVAVDCRDLGVGPEGRRLHGAIALDQDDDERDQHERDHLADRLGQLPLGLGGVLGLIFGLLGSGVRGRLLGGLGGVGHGSSR